MTFLWLKALIVENNAIQMLLTHASPEHFHAAFCTISRVICNTKILAKQRGEIGEAPRSFPRGFECTCNKYSMVLAAWLTHSSVKSNFVKSISRWAAITATYHRKFASQVARSIRFQGKLFPDGQKFLLRVLIEFRRQRSLQELHNRKLHDTIFHFHPRASSYPICSLRKSCT